jgi:DNA repair photolyase
LKVCAEYQNPVDIITKSPLIERDLDLLLELQRAAGLGVTLSVPLWDETKARALEPSVATPRRRMRTIERLATAGLEVGVNVAPLIPGLGDEDIVAVLTAAHGAGARRAGASFLRLPGSVEAVFTERLRETLPLRADRVLAGIRAARGGRMSDSRFGARHRGEGPQAEAAMALFMSTARRLGLSTEHRPQGPSRFRRPCDTQQLLLL